MARTVSEGLRTIADTDLSGLLGQFAELRAEAETPIQAKFKTEPQLKGLENELGSISAKINDLSMAIELFKVQFLGLSKKIAGVESFNQLPSLFDKLNNAIDGLKNTNQSGFSYLITKLEKIISEFANIANSQNITGLSELINKLDVGIDQFIEFTKSQDQSVFAVLIKKLDEDIDKFEEFIKLESSKRPNSVIDEVNNGLKELIMQIKEMNRAMEKLENLKQEDIDVNKMMAELERAKLRV